MLARPRFDGNFVLISLFAVFAWAPLTAPGFFLRAHDASHSAYFLWQFDANVRAGVFYPIWAPDWTFGYGYPLFLVIAPLPYYLAELFHLAGLDLIGAIKAVYLLGFLGSGWAMYLLARGLFSKGEGGPSIAPGGRGAGLVAATAYVYVPYHLVDSYVRADLGEFTVFALLPLVVFGFTRLVEADDRRDRVTWTAVSALAYGGLILTHMIAALIFTPLLGAYVLFISLLARPRSFTGKERLLRLIPAGAAALLALAVSAVYWLPGLVETRYVQSANLVGGSYSYRNHFVYLFQLFSPFWGYGYAGIGPNDQMSFQIGLVPVVFGLGAASVFFTNKELRPYLCFFVAAALVYTLAMLSLAQPLWQAGQRLAVFVQFPWRLLMVVTLTASLMAGALILSSSKEPGAMNTGVAALLLLALTTGFPYSTPQYTGANISLKHMIQFQLDAGELLGDTIWVSQRPTSSPLVPLYLEERPLVKAAALDGEAKVMTISHGAVSEAIEVLAPRGTSVLFYNHYFPGWRGFLDGQEIAIRPQGPQGLISLEVPAGEHRVEIRLGDTAVRSFGKLLSLLGWVIALVALFGARVWRLSLRVKESL